jgi:hypothetical protein
MKTFEHCTLVIFGADGIRRLSGRADRFWRHSLEPHCADLRGCRQS